jgi:multidrug efflux pump subunit AcrA (membrane-fusion protein)
MNPTLFLVVAAGLVLVLVVLLLLRKISRVAFIALAVVVALIGALMATKISQFKAMGGAKWAPPPSVVTTASVTAADWEPILPATGTLVAVQGVTVSAQLDGNVARIAFEAGTTVRAGDLLVQQDVTVETAQLQAAQAAADLARVNLRRSRELLSTATISQQQFDSDSANYKQALAQEGNIQATIHKKTILAPFSGQLGIRRVNLGQTLRAGDPIVSLQVLNPIYADFYLPQQDLPLIGTGTKVRVASDAIKGGKTEGRITAINPMSTPPPATFWPKPPWPIRRGACGRACSPMSRSSCPPGRSSWSFPPPPCFTPPSAIPSLCSSRAPTAPPRSCASSLSGWARPGGILSRWKAG